ncbi:hypothetical protein CHH83_18435 [Bacillus sp. 7586-K]|uniref:FtsW/RodA/SpoVE family cell cycle protein n=1 Tax=Metabacillus niabensis TaxID=324854 RepID=UPI000BA6F5CA|nr:hypothetical protein CHH83_18435 [Bacillus sp. 7586-K]
MSHFKERFLAEVLQNIKSKEAKEVVYKELNYHVKMSKAELVAKGESETDAEEKAIKKMGSPTDLGIHFNKLYRPIFDWKLFGLFIIIILMSLLPHVNVDHYSINLLSKQLIFIVLGIITTIIVMFIDYRKIKSIGWLFLIVAFGLLLVLNYLPNVIVNGVGYFSLVVIMISGSSLLPLFLVFWAFYLSKEKPKLLVVLGVYLPSVFLFLRLPSFTDAFIYSVMVLALLFCSSISKKAIYSTIVAFLGPILIGAYFYLFAGGYHKQRLLGFLNPYDDTKGSGYMYIMLKDLLSKGGLFGNQEQHGFTADMTTDFAFANITYFYGWILAGFLLALIALLLFRLIVVSTEIKDPFGKQLILGICSLLSVQFVYNVGMILGFLPIISMSLPFISYGLNATLLNSLLIGIVLSVYRRKHLVVNL